MIEGLMVLGVLVHAASVAPWWVWLLLGLLAGALSVVRRRPR